jgi:hypothetical protein
VANRSTSLHAFPKGSATDLDKEFRACHTFARPNRSHPVSMPIVPQRWSEASVRARVSGTTRTRRAAWAAEVVTGPCDGCQVTTRRAGGRAAGGPNLGAWLRAIPEP